jgi:hexosaminidase
MNRLLLLIFSFSCFYFSKAQSAYPIIPRPQTIHTVKGHLPINQETVILVENDQLMNEIVFFNAQLHIITGFSLGTTRKEIPGKTTVEIKLLEDSNRISGSYELLTSSGKISIIGYNKAGVMYGLNSLLFLIQKTEKQQVFKVNHCQIIDSPRFAYRGMMLDVSRHFRSVAYIKTHLDRMVMLKLNVFHWHLTDDQGWRIEIKKYPKLTEVAAWRDGTIIGHYPGTGNDNTTHGGFYTQEQVKEIVAYAAERHITVIPEIEMPGHASAAIAAYPFLSCFPDEETVIAKHPSEASQRKGGKKVQETFGVFTDVFVPTEATFAFLQDIIDEIVPLFPGKYIHIGGDECPKDNWKRSTFCQQLIKEQGLKDEHELQSYFIRRMEKYINSKGKQIIGWDEILEGGLAPNATVMSWRGEKGGIEAAQQKHEVVMTPTTYCYFDYSQTKQEDSLVIGGFLPLEKVYGYDPMPEVLRGTENEKYVLGAQGNVWTEYIRYNSKFEYMVFPRLAALSEAVWTQPANKDWEHFQFRLPFLFQWFEQSGFNYSKAWMHNDAAEKMNRRE